MVMPHAGSALLLHKSVIWGGALNGLGALGILPCVNQVRFRRINVQKPHRPNFFRQQFLAFSKPEWDEHVPIKDLPLNCELADRRLEAREWAEHLNQLDKFYVEEMMELFHKSEMIAFYHTNPIKAADYRKAWQNGRRQGMELANFSQRVGVRGLRGTKWENCLRFFINFSPDLLQPILFSPTIEPKKLISYEKKVSEFSLIACVVYGRILSRAQVIALTTMPDLEAQRSQLLALLNYNQEKTVNLLGSTQRQLSTNLNQYIKDNTT